MNFSSFAQKLVVLHTFTELKFTIAGKLPPPPPPPPPPKSDDSCFSSAARVSLENGKSLIMSELHVGDKLKTGTCEIFQY